VNLDELGAAAVEAVDRCGLTAVEAADRQGLNRFGLIEFGEKPDDADVDVRNADYEAGRMGDADARTDRSKLNAMASRAENVYIAHLMDSSAFGRIRRRSARGPSPRVVSKK
jgi:hypothetical protein